MLDRRGDVKVLILLARSDGDFVAHWGRFKIRVTSKFSGAEIFTLDGGEIYGVTRDTDADHRSCMEKSHAKLLEPRLTQKLPFVPLLSEP